MTLARMAMPVGFLARPMSQRHRVTNTAAPPTTGRRSMWVGATTRIGVGARGRTTRSAQAQRQQEQQNAAMHHQQVQQNQAAYQRQVQENAAKYQQQVQQNQATYQRQVQENAAKYQQQVQQNQATRPAECRAISPAGATEHSDLSEAAARGTAEEGARAAITGDTTRASPAPCKSDLHLEKPRRCKVQRGFPSRCEVRCSAGLASSQTGLYGAQFPLACSNARAQPAARAAS